MLQLELNDSVATLRHELRNWLSTQTIPTLAETKDLADFVRVGRAWQKLLASQRWLGVYWPKEYGGRGLSLVEEAVVLEELARAQAPQVLGLFGLTMVGPVLIEHGTKEQKDRFLSKILSGEQIWCQGFSEPGAGSDLAAIKTKAEASADGYKITGQKVWTSFAHLADWCFVLCRTEAGSERHHGLSYLLVPMNSPGITIRPLKQISGDDEFNEVFFDEVYVPRDHMVGKPGDGWKIAISTLMHERVVLTFARHLQSESALRELLSEPHDYPLSRAALVDSIVDACAVRALAYKHLTEYAEGKKPGPEGSLDKLAWSESFQLLARRSYDRFGPLAALGEHDPEIGHIAHRYLYSRGRTIAAGTSEIQRTIIAERVIGLPRAK
jgi:alkylation response protein AidB-like acyl-CoA dehydrogenase